jgi:TolB protein
MRSAHSKGAVWLAAALLLPAASAGERPGDVAFVSIRTGDAHIFRTDGAGHDVRLTRDGTNNSQPAWSPDGNLIAYTSNRRGFPRVFVMRADGSQLRSLTDDNRIELAPSFSPDGKAVAFYSIDSATGRTELRIVPLDGGAAVSITANGKDMGPNKPSWSADGRRLAFPAEQGLKAHEVWVANRDGSGARIVSDGFNKRGKADPSMSPDGERVVYVADMRGSMHLVVTDLATGKSVDLTPGSPATHEGPKWSPDGKFITFASTRDDPTLTRTDIFVMNADGTEIRNVTRTPEEDFNPHWAADGRTIYFTSLRTGTAQLFAVDLVSGRTERVTNNTSHDMEHAPGPVALRQ